MTLPLTHQHALPEIPRGAGDGSYGTPMPLSEVGEIFAAWMMALGIIVCIFWAIHWFDLYRKHKQKGGGQ